jgi:hypothetical protein
MHRGYIKLWRKVGDSKMYRSKDLWAMWTFLLMNATHKRRNVYTGLKQVELLPGQYITGRKALALELRMSERRVRTCLKHLETNGNVTIKPTNKYSIITIVNWSTYQSDEEKNDQQNAIKRPASDQQVTTKQECKNEKNGENIINGPLQDHSSGEDPPTPPGDKKCPHQDIILLYHDTLPELNRIHVWDDTARGYLRARWREDKNRQHLSWWKAFFLYVKESAFLKGEVKNWQADLRWLVKPSNFAKVMNGAYHKNKKAFSAAIEFIEGD